MGGLAGRAQRRAGVRVVPDRRRDEVRTLLEGHQPADRVEAGHCAAILSFLDAEPRPFDRDAGDHLTAGGIVVHDGRVLLVHHRRLGMWVQPGGHIDDGDPGPAAAALREVSEETGLDRLEARGLLDVDVHTVDCGGRVVRHLDLRFLVRASGGEPRPNEEVTAARWVGLADLEALDPDRGVRRAVAKALRPPA